MSTNERICEIIVELFSSKSNEWLADKIGCPSSFLRFPKNPLEIACCESVSDDCEACCESVSDDCDACWNFAREEVILKEFCDTGERSDEKLEKSEEKNTWKDDYEKNIIFVSKLNDLMEVYGVSISFSNGSFFVNNELDRFVVIPSESEPIQFKSIAMELKK